MKKSIEVFEDVTLIGIELLYLVWGLFLAIYLPILNYLSRQTVLVFLGLKFPYSIYAIIVGMLYLISAVFLIRRRPIGMKLAVLANVLGIPFLVPIVIGLISVVLLNRPEIKAQFKK